MKSVGVSDDFHDPRSEDRAPKMRRPWCHGQRSYCQKMRGFSLVKCALVVSLCVSLFVPFVWYHSETELSLHQKQFIRSNNNGKKIMATRTYDAVETAILRLRAVGINFVAIDFDLTIIDSHTGGRWGGTADELATHVRPEFKQLLPALMHNQIHVAVCTFSPQTATIHRVLETIVGPDQVGRIPIRGNDRSWSYNGEGSKAGKQAHMASSVEELEQNGAVEITRATSVLIDDDPSNIRAALKNGVRGVWFNPEKPYHLFRDLKDLS